jgi:two-component system sensor histidine kinase and response regulator WspE
MSMDDFSQASLLELFRQETENQVGVLTAGLLALERDASSATLEAMMRAAHSLKGAARIVGLGEAVRVAHAMEDCFVAAQKGAIVLHADAVDCLLEGVDVFQRIAQTPEADAGIWSNAQAPVVEKLLHGLGAITRGERLVVAEPVVEPVAVGPVRPVRPVGQAAPVPAPTPTPPAAPAAPAPTESSERVLRVTATNLNRLLGLAGESLVESRWLTPYAASLLRLKRQQWRLSRTLEALRESLAPEALDEQAAMRLREAEQASIACLQAVAERHAELEAYSRRSANLSDRLYREALASRMRPFADGVQGFPRLVRDAARALGKEVKLDLSGETTTVDREVLEKLEAPLTHLLRNAVDHGLETPAERLQAGKAREGTLRLEARHSAGLLVIGVEDDGRGIALEPLRQAIVRRKLTTPEVAEKLSEEELLDFLFLPGFSLRDQVTEISGRGVGLDVVQTVARSIGGNVRVTTQPGQGTRFQLQLPLTLSVMRALLVEVAGEPYAFLLVRVQSALRVPRSQIEMIEGREHIACEGQRIGLVSAHQILEKGATPPGDDLSVLVLGDRAKRFGLVVDRFLGERELVVQPLDRRLGKLQDISAAALMPDGSPVLILDVQDITRSIELLISGGRLGQVQAAGSSAAHRRRKRVLVVDDSLTVRELERKLLANRGYEVEVAVDGMDGWNAVRTQAYDLVVSDVDMPRLDGIELVRLIKKDPRLKALPVMIVSYKDRAEDRQRGLDAGADYYLTKGSFHDETLLTAVTDLIGDAESAA